MRLSVIENSQCFAERMMRKQKESVTDGRTDTCRRTDRRTDGSLCGALLRWRHKNYLKKTLPST